MMYSVCVIESGKGNHFQLNLFLDFRSSLQKEKISVHNLKATNQCTHFSRIIVMCFEKFLHFRCILFLCTIFARLGWQARDGAALYVYKPGSARVTRISNDVVRLHSLSCLSLWHSWQVEPVFLPVQTRSSAGQQLGHSG